MTVTQAQVNARCRALAQHDDRVWRQAWHAAWAAPELPPIADLTDDVVRYTDLCARLKDRTAGWREWDEELAGDDKAEVAEQECREAMLRAWARLEAAEKKAGLR
jgi:hypothetical protein